MLSQKARIINLLHTLEPENILLAQELAEGLKLDISSEIDDLFELGKWLDRNRFRDNYCCLRCDGTEEKRDDYYAILSLNKKLSRLNFEANFLENISVIGEEEVPWLFYLCKNVESLYLSKLTNFSLRLIGGAKLRKLNDISFWDCSMLSVPKEVKHLKNITRLSINRGNYKQTIQHLLSMPNVEHLFIRETNIEALPASFYQLKQLKTAVIQKNNINQLDFSDHKLHQLESLDLSYNQLTEIPKGIENLPNLKRLNLKHNPIHRLPQQIGRLRRKKTALYKLR